MKLIYLIFLLIILLKLSACTPVWTYAGLRDDQPRMRKSHNLVSCRLSMRTMVVMLPCVFVDNCSPCSLHYFLLRNGAPVTQPGPNSCLRLDTFAIRGFQFGLVVALSFLHTNQPCFIAVLFLYYVPFFPEKMKRYEIYVITYQALEKRPWKQIQNLTGLSSNKLLKVNATLCYQLIHECTSALFHFFFPANRQPILLTHLRHLF